MSSNWESPQSGFHKASLRIDNIHWCYKGKKERALLIKRFTKLFYVYISMGRSFLGVHSPKKDHYMCISSLVQRAFGGIRIPLLFCFNTILFFNHVLKWLV